MHFLFIKLKEVHPVRVRCQGQTRGRIQPKEGSIQEGGAEGMTGSQIRAGANQKTDSAI